MTDAAPGRIIGRYALFDILAAGGMATVHIGRLLGPVGFARTVAIKRLHPQFARDPEFVAMFLDEARMCARIRHPNVVPTVDVVATQGELFLVMEYVQGESLSHLIRALDKRKSLIPWRVAVSIGAGMLNGLHAAHEAKDERGLPLGLVHRDVSPQNVLIGTDGMARVVDFGVAKASGRLQTTREGAVKGKLGYMAPEQMSGENLTRQADIYAAAVVMWEALTCRRLFDGDSEAVVLARVLTGEVERPSKWAPGLPKELDDLVMRNLSREAKGRCQTAREFAQALDKLGPAPLGEVGEWVETQARATLERRAEAVAAVEEGSGMLTPVASHEVPTPPAAPPATAQSGSIRPTALSEPEEEVAAPPLKSKTWLYVAAGAAAMLVGVLALALRSDGKPESALASQAPSVGASAANAAPAVTSPPSALVAETAAASNAAPEPSASAMAAPSATSPPVLTGRMPNSATHPPATATPTSTSVFDLGGRR